VLIDFNETGSATFTLLEYFDVFDIALATFSVSLARFAYSCSHILCIYFVCSSMPFNIYSFTTCFKLGK
jgi:hypothetical protein